MCVKRIWLCVLVLLMGCSSHTNQPHHPLNTSVFQTETMDTVAWFNKNLGNFYKYYALWQKRSPKCLFLLENTFSPSNSKKTNITKTFNLCEIRWVTQQMVYSGRVHNRLESPLLNTVFWLDSIRPEVVFVVFYPGFKHVKDFKFTYTSISSKWFLDSLQI